MAGTLNGCYRPHCCYRRHCDFPRCCCERNNSFYLSRANQQKAVTKIHSLTQCSLTVNECDWHILTGNDERINSHCLTRCFRFCRYSRCSCCHYCCCCCCYRCPLAVLVDFYQTLRWCWMPGGLWRWCRLLLQLWRWCRLPRVMVEGWNSYPLVWRLWICRYHLLDFSTLSTWLPSLLSLSATAALPYALTCFQPFARLVNRISGDLPGSTARSGNSYSVVVPSLESIICLCGGLTTERLPSEMPSFSESSSSW